MSGPCVKEVTRQPRFQAWTHPRSCEVRWGSQGPSASMAVTVPGYSHFPITSTDPSHTPTSIKVPLGCSGAFYRGIKSALSSQHQIRSFPWARQTAQLNTPGECPKS